MILIIVRIPKMNNNKIHIVMKTVKVKSLIIVVLMVEVLCQEVVIDYPHVRNPNMVALELKWLKVI
jgi:hypothetical protein